MHATLPRGRRSGCLLAVLVLALPALAPAQDPYPTPTPTDPLAGVPVQILQQQQVIIGGHITTYNLIAPPVFPATTPAPTPQATPATQAANRTQAVPLRRTADRAPQTRARKVTRAAQGDDGSSGDKPYAVVSLSATVYDHQFTALRWYNGSQLGLQAYVNLDFNYFGGVSTIETVDTVYQLVFGLGNDTASSLTQAGQPLPDFSSVPAGQSGYQVVAGDPGAHPVAIAALNAICAYYDGNSAQMMAAYNQQQADNAAYQQWLQSHPPVQPNTVINFWPVKSQVYLPTGH